MRRNGGSVWRKVGVRAVELVEEEHSWAPLQRGDKAMAWGLASQYAKREFLEHGATRTRRDLKPFTSRGEEGIQIYVYMRVWEFLKGGCVYVSMCV
jgi:hypothetical protein